MKNTQKSSRFALTLLISFIVFLIFFFALVLVNSAILILIITGVYRPELHGYSGIAMFMVTMSVASLIVGAIAAGIIVHIPLKPINRLISSIDSLASGDYSVRIKQKGILKKMPLFVELTDSFNTLAEELQNTEMFRSDFVNNFSHEFKTPIVSIAGFAKLLKKGNVTEEQRQEYLSIIEEESLRLSQMATAVLNLTKIENQEILTDVKNYNLSEQIRTCILMLEEKWAEKNLNLIVNFDEYDIEANEDMLKQVWLNLIDNAIKFVPENGTVEVSVQTEEKHIKVCVFNSGSFVPEESRDKIFNKFYQADESHYSHGNGIGLAVAKKIIELHKGEIQVFSDDKGTYFTVILTV